MRQPPAILNSEPTCSTLGSGGFFRLVTDNGWESVQFLRGASIAMIAAVTNDSELILIEQRRQPLLPPVIELPGGLVGDIDLFETPEDAARRELLEETGYEAQNLALLFSGPLAPGLTSQHLFLFHARHPRPAQLLSSVDDIRIHKVYLGHVAEWLLSLDPKSILVDLKVFASLSLLSANPAMRARPTLTSHRAKDVEE